MTSNSEWKGSGTVRGAALILNYEFHGKLELKRTGSEKDMQRITKVLKNHGYEIRAHTDLSYKDTEEIFKSFIEDGVHDKNDTDSTVVVIMSHGDAAHEFMGSVFLTYDEIFMASQPIVDKFQHVLGLEGKPKLFFFNFCRVDQPLHDLSTEAMNKMMNGYFRREAEFWLDETAVRNTIPDQKSNRLYNDTLIVYSTLPRFPSYRSADSGSFFIQDLCKILEDPKQVATKDIALLLDEVDKELKERAKIMEHDPEFKYYTQTPDRINRGFNKKFFLRSFQTLRSYYLDNLCNVKPLPWSTQFNWSVDEIYTPLVVTNTDHSKESFMTEDLFKRLEKRFPNGSGLRCFIEGNPGYGKSTLMLKLTSDWAKLSSCSYLSRFHLVLLVKLREVGEKGDLEKRILEIYRNKIEWASESDIFESELADKVLVLLDGYDEANGNTKETVTKIMVKELWSQSHVVLTSRFGYVTDDVKSNSNALCAKLEGFQKKDVAVAVGKFLVKAGHRTKAEVGETMLERLLLSEWSDSDQEEGEEEESENSDQEEDVEEFCRSEESSVSTDDDSRHDSEQGDYDDYSEDEISENSNPSCQLLEIFLDVQDIESLLPAESRLDKYQLEDFISKLLDKTPFKDLARCPLLCFMLCCLVTEFPKNRLPQSMTDLYFAIINRNLYRAAHRKAPPGEFNEKWNWNLLRSKFRKDHEEELKNFGLICLEYIKSSSPHFTLFELTGDSETSDPDHPKVTFLLEAGVIIEGDSTSLVPVYHPVHRTMAEFLAAYCLTQIKDDCIVEGHVLELYSKGTSYKEISTLCYELSGGKTEDMSVSILRWAIGGPCPLNTEDCCNKKMVHGIGRNGLAVRTKDSHAYFIACDSRVYFSFENLAATSAWNHLSLVLRKCIERKRRLQNISITFFGPIGAENTDSVAVSSKECVGILKSIIGSRSCPQELKIQIKGLESSKEGEEIKDQAGKVVVALLTAIQDPPKHCVLRRLKLANIQLKGEALDSFITTILKSSIKCLEIEYGSCTFKTAQLKKFVKAYSARAGFRLKDICARDMQLILQDPEAFDLDPISFPLQNLHICKCLFTPKLLEWIASSLCNLRTLTFLILPPGSWQLETEALQMLLLNNANTLEEFNLVTNQVYFPKEVWDACMADLNYFSPHNDDAGKGNLLQSLHNIIPLCAQLKKIKIWSFAELPVRSETASSIDKALIDLQKKILELPFLNELLLPPYGAAFFNALADLAHKWPGEEESTSLLLWHSTEWEIAEMETILRERDFNYRIDKTLVPVYQIWFPPKPSPPEQTYKPVSRETDSRHSSQETEIEYSCDSG